MTRIYFEFLRFSLDDSRPLPKGIEDVDWHSLFDFAKKQSLIGLYFRGINRLPKGTTTDIAPLAKWTILAQKIRQKNVIVTKAADKISRYFAENGYRSFILKGQGNALMYPEPWLRTPGDVDICVASKDADVIAFCRKHLHGGKAGYHHIDIEDVDGVSVEVHYRPSFLLNPVHNKRLQKWFKKNADAQCSNVADAGIGDKDYRFSVPTTYYNIIYQLLHMEKHVVQSGFGLRQLVDYYQLLMTADLDILQSEAIQKDLKRFGLHKFAGAIMWVMQTCLQLPDERLIAKPEAKFGKLILDDMLEGGNFGYYNESVADWKRNTTLGQNIYRLERDMKLCWYYPSEVLFEPFFRVYHYFWRLKHK